MLIGAALLLAALMLLASCQDSPYEDLSEDGYNVCVRFDANGGDFAQNGTYMTIVDIYQSGKDKITIYAPNAEIRGPEFKNYDAEKSMSQYKLEGWYIVPTNDKGEILDKDGNPCKESGKEPAFGQRMNFELTDKDGNIITDANDKPIMNKGVEFKLDAGKSYTRENPLTVCAKWVPHYTVEFYTENDSGEWVQFSKTDKDGSTVTLKYSGNIIELPALNTLRSENCKDGYGNWDFYKFDPRAYDQFKAGYTFAGAYLDPECTVEIPLTNFDKANKYNGSEYYALHPELNPENDPIKIYTKWEEGNWFSIYTADQFSSVVNSIVNTTLTESDRLTDVKIRIMADLDFGSSSEYGWLFDDLKGDLGMTIDEAAFEGLNLYIDGRGHSFKNIASTAPADSRYGGIFKKLADSAVIKNLTIEDSSFTVPAYSGKDTALFGFFAGNQSGSATIENIILKNCTIIVGASVADKAANNTVEIYAGTPDEASGIDFSGVSVSVPDGYKATVTADGYIKFEKTTV